LTTRRRARQHTEYHKDGSVWAKGQMAGGVPTGRWKWFRKDGTLMRSGSFLNGVQVGKWTTFDKTGAVYKVTVMKAPSCET
jgi:antitoxin component YwqK of YwqJK toxin-antitoxin module